MKTLLILVAILTVVCNSQDIEEHLYEDDLPKHQSVKDFSKFQREGGLSEQEISFSKKMIYEELKKQMEGYDDEPWRWYHFVGIGLLIMILLPLVRCMCGLCLVGCVFCAGLCAALGIEAVNRFAIWKQQRRWQKQYTRQKKSSSHTQNGETQSPKVLHSSEYQEEQQLQQEEEMTNFQQKDA